MFIQFGTPVFVGNDSEKFVYIQASVFEPVDEDWRMRSWYLFVPSQQRKH